MYKKLFTHIVYEKSYISDNFSITETLQATVYSLKTKFKRLTSL